MQKEKPDDLPTRPSLLRRLRNWEDDASWNDFVRTYSNFIRGIAFKAGLSASEAEDVSQETLVAVAKQMLPTMFCASHTSPYAPDPIFRINV